MARGGALFLDTSGWLAALLPSQTGHDRAREAYADAAKRGELLVTTTLVAAEMHSLILRAGSVHAGETFLEAVFDGGTHLVVPNDTGLVQAAIGRWIRPYRDQRFSLCDAVSFEVMRQERIGRALAYDKHFATAGYETL